MTQKENDTIYRTAYNFVRGYGSRSVSSILKICDRYGLISEKKKLEKVVEEVRQSVEKSIGSKK